jgi:hypothetical protein
VEHEDDSEMMEEESERVGRHIEETREDWEAKQHDTGVPGAQPDPDEEKTATGHPDAAGGEDPDKS